MAPIPAPVVNEMTPSMVAGTLGLDRVPLIMAQPLEDDLPPVETGIPTMPRERSIRRIVRG